METLTIEHANAMPAPTWHRLKMNDTEIELPADLPFARQVEVECAEELLGDAEAFPMAVAAQRFREQPAACAADQEPSPVEPATAPTTAALQVDDPATRPAATGADPAEHQIDDPAAPPAATIGETALSFYQQQALEALHLSPADVFVTGMGDEAREYLEFAAGDPLVFATRPGERACATVRVDGVDGAVNAAAIDVVAAPGSTLSLALSFDSPAPGAGVVGARLRVLAEEDARVDLFVTQTLEDGWTVLDDAGIVLAERARVQVRHTVLGAGRAFAGLDADLRGDDARLDLDTRYVGHDRQERDFNYVAHQRGRRTVCNLDANGVLAGASTKTLRGTIELAHGCKGSTGSEQETVLLADERAANRTVPVILCAEDDVAGNHGAAIGHVRPEQLLYLASRGISPDDAERLFVVAAYQEAALAAPDERARAAVARLAAARGIALEEEVA